MSVFQSSLLHVLEEILRSCSCSALHVVGGVYGSTMFRAEAFLKYSTKLSRVMVSSTGVLAYVEEKIT